MERVITTKLPAPSQTFLTPKSTGICFLSVGLILLGTPLCWIVFPNYQDYNNDIKLKLNTDEYSSSPSFESCKALDYSEINVFLTRQAGCFLFYSIGKFFYEYVPRLIASFLTMLFAICTGYVGLVHLGVTNTT